MGRWNSLANAVAGAAVSAVLSAPALSAEPDAPVAQPGQCFARITLPAQVENYAEERIVAPARTETRTVPAVVETVDVQILVKEPTLEWVVTPGVYRSVSATEIVTPARVVPFVQPAVTENYVERVMVRPAYVTWREGCGVLGRTEASGAQRGDLLCRVETPAQYAQVPRVRLVKPAQTIDRTLPAVTRQIVRQELVTPAKIEQRLSQPIYRTEKQRRVAREAHEETVTIPEVRRTELLRRVLAPARTEWREVVCRAHATPARLQAVQKALTARGYAATPDGVFGPATLAAMEAFQRANGLAPGYLSIETLQALGVPAR